MSEGEGQVTEALIFPLQLLFWLLHPLLSYILCKDFLGTVGDACFLVWVGDERGKEGLKLSAFDRSQGPGPSSV